jgi:hypothetical protein
MDPKSLDDLEIEVIERYTYDARVEHNRLYIDQLVNLFLSKLFDNDKFVYKLDDYIPELTVYVFSNIFDTVYMKYVFQELKLTDYSKFNLAYSSTDIAKWTFKFSYRSFFVLSGEESKYKNEMAPEYTKILNNDEAESTKLSDTPTNIEKDGLTKTPVQHGSEPNMSPLKGPDQGGMTPMNDLKADPTSKFTPEQAAQQDNVSLEPGEMSKEEPTLPADVPNNDITKNDINSVLKTEKQKAEFEHFVDEFKKTEQGKDFDPTTSTFVYYDMASNKQYYVENGQIVKQAFAYVSNTDSDVTNGEAPEGVYIERELNSGVKHLTKKKNTEAALSNANIDTAEVLAAVSLEPDSTFKDTLKAAGVTGLKNSEYSYIAASEFSDNLIDSGNNKTEREKTYKGIHVHSYENAFAGNNQNIINSAIKDYEEKERAGTATDEDRAAIRTELSKNRSKKDGEFVAATQGCTVMSDADLAFDAKFRQEHGNEVVVFKGNGTSKGNTKNDEMVMEKYNEKKSTPEPSYGQTKYTQPKEAEEPKESKPAQQKQQQQQKQKQQKQQAKKSAVKQQMPPMITLYESDIDKYVHGFIAKTAAKGYFYANKSKDNTVTIPADEKLIDQYVPEMFRDTARQVFRDYMKDHPIKTK